MEAAGVALGGFPVLIWVIDKYRDPVKTYFRYSTVLDTFRSDLFMQQEQLRATLEIIGINNFPPEPDELEDSLSRLPEHRRKRFIDIIGEVNRIVHTLLSKVEVDLKGKPKWTDVPPERAMWEWRKVRRSLGSRARKEAIENLQRWNNALRNCFERQELPSEDAPTRNIAAVQKAFSLDRCNETRDHVVAIHRVLESGWKCDCRPAHLATINLACYDAGQDPKFIITMSKCTSSTACSEHWSRVNMWVVEDESLQANPATCQKDLREIVRTTGQKTSLEGFLSDIDPLNSRKRRVHFSSIDPPLPAPLELISLRGLLLPRHMPRALKLSRKQRYGIAAATTWGVLHLSHSPWLPETWQKDEIQLFLRNCAGPQALLEQTPCMSSMFYRGTAAKGKGTDMNSRSQALRDLFQLKHVRNKTLFALGIFLIELGLNQSFEDLRQQSAKYADGHTPSTLDDYELAIELADDVDLDAGPLYGDAIRRCLRCEFPGRDVTKTFEYIPFRQQFFDFVVAPVQVTFDLCI